MQDSMKSLKHFLQDQIGKAEAKKEALNHDMKNLSIYKQIATSWN